MSEETTKKKGCIAATFGLIGRMLKAIGSTYASLWRKSKGWGKAALILVPLLLCGFLGALGGSDPSITDATATAQVAEDVATETPAPTRTKPPTRTPKPTRTPRPTEPTNTPRPTEPTNTPYPTVPTDTPAPTDTPPPTAIPSDTPVPVGGIPIEVQEYFGEVLPWTEIIGNSSANIGELFQATQIDEAWMTQVLLEIAMIQTAHEAVLEVEPPEEVAHIHTALLEATSRMDSAVDILYKGMETSDASKIEQSANLMIEAQEKTNAVMVLLLEYMEQHQ